MQKAWLNPMTGEEITPYFHDMGQSGNDNYPSHSPAPWEQAGHYYSLEEGHYSPSGSNLYKRPEAERTSLCSAIASFYMLEGMAGLALPIPDLDQEAMPAPLAGVNPSLQSFLPKSGKRGQRLVDLACTATVMFDEYTTWLADLIDDYLHYAISTEVAYHYHANDRFGEGTSHHAWQALIQRHGKEQTADWAMDLFSDEDAWEDGYGGEAWWNIADCVHSYARGSSRGFNFTKREFIDQAFSLEHNGGNCFDKQEWPNFSSAWEALDAHHTGDTHELFRNLDNEDYDDDDYRDDFGGKQLSVATAVKELYATYTTTIKETT